MSQLHSAGLARVPRATYRLQLNHTFPLPSAQAILDYLAELGISDVYASPIFKARRGSMHGYDVCDPRVINPELGGEAAFAAFSQRLHELGLGLILDVVPNHMGINDAGNLWWWDVLENGPCSLYAGYFDIDWQPVKQALSDKVLLPILDDQYGRSLEKGTFRLTLEQGAFILHCNDLPLPIAPDSYGLILSHRLNQLIEQIGPTHEDTLELQSILTAVNYLPRGHELEQSRRLERNREKEVIKRRLARLVESSAAVREMIAATLTDFAGIVGQPASFDLMDHLIAAQSYRPAYWRVASEEINYRRFFNINDLAAIRVEEAEVFEATHKLVFHLLKTGQCTGLRIDHPDGLRDPRAYFEQLQSRYRQLCGDQVQGDLYIVAEKILAMNEPLPEDWAVAGTTGYDFANVVNGLFVSRANREPFDRIYRKFTGIDANYSEIEHTQKSQVMQLSLAGEVNTLAHQLSRICERNRLYRDFTLNSLRDVLREFIACLPVYRTYITETRKSARDIEYVERAARVAMQRDPLLSDSLVEFVRDVLLLRNLGDFPESERQAVINFTLKFQQVTGPVTAKGVEDSAFYVYYRLVSLNEVGGTPARFGTTLVGFHRRNLDTRRQHPHTMLATSTHDNKRSEDVRARINVLSEMPNEWRVWVNRFARINAAAKTVVEEHPAPDRNDEYMIYQTILGAWPLELLDGDPPGVLAQFRERLIAYFIKAARESGRHTTWLNPNTEYEHALRHFVERILPDEPNATFRSEMRRILTRVVRIGQFNSLSQTLLKLTCIGVPDIYQGNEVWDFSLVDPDNRRPVDYEHRRALLAGLRQRLAEGGDAVRAELADELLANPNDGRIKLYVIYTTLQLRREQPKLFEQGQYVPVRAEGGRRNFVAAFARVHNGRRVLVVAPRLILTLCGRQPAPVGPVVWEDTWLDLPRDPTSRVYRNCFTSEKLAVQEQDGMTGLALGDVLRRFPVALLEQLD